jgi:drug/metabolite transporter (DMT)-like permease
MIIYGANYVIMKKVTPAHVMPFGLAVYRITGALLLFLLSSVFIREKAHKKDIRLCALLAVFGVACNQTLFITGLSLTSPINASIMMLTSPLLVLVISILLRREKGTLLKYLGVLVGTGGSLLVILTGNSHKGMNAPDWHGDLMILGNALSWGIFLIFSRPLMVKYHTVTVMKWVFLFGSIYTFPLGILQAREVNFDGFDSATWFNFLYVIVATTYLAYLLNTYALKRLSSSNVSAYIYLQPFLAACFGLIFGMDQLSFWRIVGAGIVFVGVFMVSYRPNKPVPEKMKEDATLPDR